MWMLRILIALMAAQIAAPAIAAPQNNTTPPPFVWTGFYGGANGGYGFGSHCWYFAQVGAAFRDQGCSDVSGGVGGGQFGFNWQTGSFVLGAEASGNWGKINGSNTSSNVQQSTGHVSISQIAMLTGRIGYAFDQFLFYGKSGTAFVRQRVERTCNGLTSTGNCTPVGAVSGSGDQNRQSFVVGGGIEYAISRSLTVALDYSYLPMGDKDAGYASMPGYTCGAGPGQKCSMSGDEKLSVVTARINWLFGAR